MKTPASGGIRTNNFFFHGLLSTATTQIQQPELSTFGIS